MYYDRKQVYPKRSTATVKNLRYQQMNAFRLKKYPVPMHVIHNAIQYTHTVIINDAILK